MFASHTRLFLGAVAGALSILVFHQTTLQIFFWLGWAPYAAFRLAHVAPFNAPLVVSMTFWGAVYGGIFGILMPLTKGPLWFKGMIAGLCAMSLAWFVFLPLMGREVAFSWQLGPMVRSFLAYQVWGLGLSIVLPLLLPRRIGGSRQPWDSQRLAA